MPPFFFSGILVGVIRILVAIDLTSADLPLFEEYETAVLGLVAERGGRVENRWRAERDTAEFHLLSFPAADALHAFMEDPRRVAMAPLREACGAHFSMHVVRELSPP